MPKYDVFLCHNSQDKPVVETLAGRLMDDADLQPFLDKWHLVPGEPMQETIEDALDQSQTCAVSIGQVAPAPSKVNRCARRSNSYQQRGTLRHAGADRGERSRLPPFLALATWIEFRESSDDPEAFRCLVAGIRC